MASFTKRGDVWRAQVFKAGQRFTATFDSKKEAQDWAAAKEAEILAGLKQRTSKTLHDAIDKYAAEELPKRKDGGDNDGCVLRKLKREISNLPLISDKLPAAVATWRNESLQTLKPGSVLRYMTVLKMVCEVARRDWKWIAENPLAEVRSPKAPRPRDRILTPVEIEAMLEQLGWRDATPETPEQETALAMLIALETGMRSSEITELDVKWLRGKILYLPDSKNSDAREVPLSLRARELWGMVPAKSGKAFSLTPDNRDKIFRKARKKAGLSGFTFHDTRATAITRLSKRLDILALAKMIGHRDIKSLMIYYREDAASIADRLG